MTRVHRESFFSRAAQVVASLSIWAVCGCGGSLRHAVLEHAAATQAVAVTLTRAVAGVGCAGDADAMSRCKASVGIIEAQADALHKSAERLQRAAQ